MSEDKNLPAEPINFMDKIKEKIKNSFIDLVPEETWDKMVQQEIDNFFEAKMSFSCDVVNESGWGTNKRTKTKINFEGDNELHPTMFRTLIWDECIARTKEHITSKHVDDMFNASMDSNGQMMSKRFDDLITTSMPIIIDTYFKNMMKSTALNMRQNIMNDIQNNRF